jgi:hypothetical protein
MDIWAEGFKSAGVSGEAVFCGTVPSGLSLKKSCRKLAEEDPAFSDYFNSSKMTYWGCKIFDNEKAARKSFG